MGKQAGIRSTYPNLPPQVRDALQRIAERVQVWEGSRGDRLDRVLTLRDLLNDTDVAKAFSSLKGRGAGGIAGAIAPPPVTAPPAPTNLAANGAFSNVILTWDFTKAYRSLSHFEIWRNTADALGSATLIGTTAATVYADEVESGRRYYYWVRAVSVGSPPLYSPYNATAGVVGETAYDPSYVMDLLTVKWKPSTAYSVGDYVMPSPANDTGLWFKVVSVAGAGQSGATEPVWPTSVGGTVVDNEVTWQAVAAGSEDIPFVIGEVGGSPAVVMNADTYIADASIDDAKIKNLRADKLFAASGTIADAVIGNGHITNAMIGQVIQSDVFDPATGTGWKIDKSGLIEAGGIKIYDKYGSVILSSGSGNSVELASQIANNLINPATWVPGTTGDQPGFNAFASQTRNRVIIGLGPMGAPVTLWEGSAAGGNTADSGWHTDRFRVNPDRPYRFTAFVKRVFSDTGAKSYFGLYAFDSNGGQIGVARVTDNAIVTNPYFVNGVQLQVNKWYLFVGYVFPQSHTDTAVYGGVIDIDTGDVVFNANSFKWLSSTVEALHRAYMYFSATTTPLQYMTHPRVDIVDGNEPSIQSLLSQAATITAQGTAAAIQNQGALATKNSADWQADVTGTGKPEDNATAGATWGSNITGQPADKALLNEQIVQGAQGFLPNFSLDIADAQGKPAGIQPVEALPWSDRSGVSFGDASQTFMRIRHPSASIVAYGWPAIPIDDRQKYRVTVRHRSSAATADGLYIRFNELNAPLPQGKTHIGADTDGRRVARSSWSNLFAFGPMPGDGGGTGAWTELEFVYTPPLGVQWASFAIYNWGYAATIDLDIDAVLISPIAKTASDITYGDGTAVENLKPAQAGADKTSSNPQSPAWLSSPVVWSGNKITSGNIGTYMSSAAITTAYIKDANITTLKLAGQAVTIPVSVYTGSTIYIYSGTTLQSASIASSGAPIMVMATVFLKPPNPSSSYVRLRILRGGVVIYDLSPAVKASSGEALVTITLRDVPGAGNVTYYLEATKYVSPGTGSTDAYANRRSLLLLETKR